MQRLIEQPADEGSVRGNGRRLGRVHYHLAVYQHFSVVEGEPVPSHVEVEGRVTALDDLNLAGLHREGLELTLHLADGRSLDFHMVDEAGAIHSTGRGLYPPEHTTRP